LRRLQRRVELRGRILLHSGQDVAVEIESRPHSRMPQPFAGNLGMDAQSQHVCCVGVPQVVKPDTREAGGADEVDPFVGDERRLHK
jgi:hypothetical protein